MTASVLRMWSTPASYEEKYMRSIQATLYINILKDIKLQLTTGPPLTNFALVNDHTGFPLPEFLVPFDNWNVRQTVLFDYPYFFVLYKFQDLTVSTLNLYSVLNSSGNNDMTLLEPSIILAQPNLKRHYFILVTGFFQEHFMVASCTDYNFPLAIVHDLCFIKIDTTSVPPKIAQFHPIIVQKPGSEWGEIKNIILSYTDGIVITVLGSHMGLSRVITLKIHKGCHSDCATCYLNSDSSSCLTCPILPNPRFF
jgi:hypothetical protein